MRSAETINRTAASLPDSFAPRPGRIVDGRARDWPVTALRLLTSGADAIVVDAPEPFGADGAPLDLGILDAVKNRVLLAWPFASSPAVSQARERGGAGLLPDGAAVLRLTVTAAPERTLEAVTADALLTLRELFGVPASAEWPTGPSGVLRLDRRSSQVVTLAGRLGGLAVTGTVTTHALGSQGLRLEILGSGGDTHPEIPDGGAAPARVAFLDSRGEFVLPTLWESSLRCTLRHAADDGRPPASSRPASLTSLTELLSRWSGKDAGAHVHSQ